LRAILVYWIARPLVQALCKFAKVFRSSANFRTAAEILDDEVRAVICPDKVNTQEWLNIMRDAHAAGLRGIHGGALVNSAAAEVLTSILIFVNKTYQVDGAGIAITGTLTEPE
jgi:predicted dinucleotide-binding enzyme